MLLYIGLSVIIVAASLVTMNRAVNMRTLLGYASIFDIVFAVSIFEAFGGTFSGLMVAASSGLLMAVVLTGMRWTMGYQYLWLVRKRAYLLPRLVWWQVEPRWAL